MIFLPSIPMTYPPVSNLEMAETATVATAAMNAKQWAMAVDGWLRCLALQGAQPSVAYQAKLLACYLGSKRLDEARLLLEKALSAHPYDVDLMIQRAELASQEKNDHAAIQNWCVCVALDAKKVPVAGFKKLAEALRRAGKLEHARAIIAQGFQHFPDAPMLLIESAQIAADDRPEIAANLWLKAIENYRGLMPVGIYMSCCQALLKIGKYSKCLEILELARINHPNDARITQKFKEVKILCQVDITIVAEKQDDYRFIYYKQKQGTKIIVFTFGTIYTSLTSPAFGFPFLIAEGFDHVHVAHGLRRQYQELTLDEFAIIAQPLCEDKMAYTYGSSLGGYAAIYFASAIQACAIASSPTLPAHKSAKRFPYEKIQIKHIPIEKFKSNVRNYIFFDPYDIEDANFLNNILVEACADLIRIPLPFSGHQALRILAEAGLLKETIIKIIRDQPDVLEFDDKKFQSTSVYLEQSALHHEKNGLYHQAMDVGRQCLAKKQRLRAFNVVIRCALKLGQVELARQLYGEALATFPSDKLTKLPVLAQQPCSPASGRHEMT